MEVVKTRMQMAQIMLCVENPRHLHPRPYPFCTKGR